MGFPFLTGFITKNWVKADLPYEAKIIYTTAALLTSTVYARLIFDRVSTYIRTCKPLPLLSLTKLSRNVTDAMNSYKVWILTISLFMLVSFSLLSMDIYSAYNIRSAVVSAILGGVLFISVIGIRADEFVKPVTRTLDLVGAPFLVAALLLANLLYFKI